MPFRLPRTGLRGSSSPARSSREPRPAILKAHVHAEQRRATRAPAARIDPAHDPACSVGAPHASCARSFVTLWKKERALAEQLGKAALDLLEKKLG